MKPWCMPLVRWQAQTQTVRWVAPPPGTLGHGWYWVRSPGWVVATVLAAVAIVVGVSWVQRLRRR